jgi:hypothetical protein
MQDPFAAPAEEAQTQTDNPLSADEIRAKSASVFQAGEGKIVTTLKAGAGYDQPWVVIHANSIEESDALLDEKFAEYLAKVKRVAAHFNGGGSKPTTNASPQSPQQLQPGQPAGSVQPPSWAPPMPDGYLYKTGAKNGKVWHAYWPVDSRSGLEKIWLNPPK